MTVGQERTLAIAKSRIARMREEIANGKENDGTVKVIQDLLNLSTDLLRQVSELEIAVRQYKYGMRVIM